MNYKPIILGFISTLFLICAQVIMPTTYGQSVQKEWMTYYSGNKTQPNIIVNDSKNKYIYVVGITYDTFNIGTDGTHRDTLISDGDKYSSTDTFLDHFYTDIFIAKFDYEGNKIWGTYYGGTKEEELTMVKLDTAGNIYILGMTESSNGIATKGSYKDSMSVTPHWLCMFLAKFDSSGNQVWGTYFSGDSINAIPINMDIDNMGNLYVVGTTNDPDIGTPGAYISSLDSIGGIGGYISKFNSNGHLIWCTYYGASTMYISVESDQLYIMGRGSDTDHISGTPGTYQSAPLLSSSFPPFPPFSFIVNFDTNCNYNWLTFVTDTMYNGIVPYQITTDTAKNIYISGYAKAVSNVSTPGVFEETKTTDQPLFIMKFDKSGKRKWGTYFNVLDHGIVSNALIFNYLSDYSGVYSGNNLSYSDIDQALYLSSYYGLYVNKSKYQPYNLNDSIATSCTYEPLDTVRKGIFARFTPEGQREWASYFDEGMYGFCVVPQYQSKAGSDIYISMRTRFNDLSTPGAYQTTKVDTTYSGLIGKFTQTCPNISVGIYPHFDSLSTDDGFERYEWYNNGALVSIGSTPYYAGSIDTGYYYVKAVKCGCWYTSDTIYFDGTDIRNPEMTQQWHLHPNPANDYLNIDLSRLQSQNMEVSVVDMLGRAVIVIQNVKNELMLIDVKGLSGGVYYVKVTTPQGSSVKKWVKL